jgi:group II intron reverse transcriptase/maturase
VRRNKGAHGLDRVTIRHFEADWETHLREIQRKLKERRYVPQPVRRVYIPKASDPRARRPLGIPVVADRIVQQALHQVLDPLFDHELSERSFAYRKGRKAHHAIATLLRDAEEGYRHVVDADLASFFDRLDHQVVMSRVRARIADGRVLRLIEAFLKAGVSESGVVTVPTEGCPQGGVISPWLSNLVLDDLDKALEARLYRHVRYADDFVVLCRSREEAEEALRYTKEVLSELKLSLNESKTRLSSFYEGFEFLGHRFRRYRLGIRDKAVDRFKDKVRLLTRRQQGRNVDAVLEDLNPVIRGFARYFGAAEVTTTLRDLDRWIRMRIRAFKFKRKCRNDNWRLPTPKLAKWGLLSLQDCRPGFRLLYEKRVERPWRAWSGSLRRGNHAGSPSVLTAHADQMAPLAGGRQATKGGRR